MKSYWDQLRMTSLVFSACYDRELDLLRYRLCLTNSTIHRWYSGRYSYKPFVSTSAKVKCVISLDVMRTQDSSAHTLLSTLSRLKKVTTARHKDNLNFSNFFISKNLGCQSR